MRFPLAALKSLALGRAPGQLVIQYTDHCNARCPQCGMRTDNRFPRSTLAPELVERALKSAARRGVKAVSFTGGEPLLLLDRLVAMLNRAGELGMTHIRTGTNGFALAHKGGPAPRDRLQKLARTLAATPVRNFWISLDSADPATHEAMRGFPGVVEGMARALPIFHRRGLYPSANLGINRRVGGRETAELHPGDFAQREEYLRALDRAYGTAFRAFFRLARDLGFSMVNACYPMSLEEGDRERGLSAVYAATSTQGVVSYAPDEKRVVYGAYARAAARWRGRIRIFSPLASLRAMIRHYAGEAEESYACRGGLEFFFMDAARGDIYPCGYRGGEALGRAGKIPRSRAWARANCRRCDWECFRDPSELFGPVLELAAHPLGLLRRLRRDPGFWAVWREDLAYYRACRFFDGRRPAEPERLIRFGSGEAADEGKPGLTPIPDAAGGQPPRGWEMVKKVFPPVSTP